MNPGIGWPKTEPPVGAIFRLHRSHYTFIETDVLCPSSRSQVVMWTNSFNLLITLGDMLGELRLDAVDPLLM